jgi:predicted nucleotidyltransferase
MPGVMRTTATETVIKIRAVDLELLKSIIGRFVPLSSVIVYGSRCRETATNISDIDILLLEPSISVASVSVLRESLDESNIGPRVDLHTAAELPDSWIQAILGTGVRLDSAVASGG